MPVQQHPIPANVTSYQFRLVGDLTLKQFLQIAAGVIVAVIIYALPLPFFFKYPLMAIAAGIGAAIAFLPVQGRPLDQWIVAFVRSIYQPTIYTWQKPADENAARINITPTQSPTVVPTPTQTVSNQQTITTNTVPSAPITTNYPNIPSTPSPQPPVKHPDLTPQPHTLTRTGQTVTDTTSSPTLTQPSIQDISRHAREIQIPQSPLTAIEKQLRPEVTQTKSPVGEITNIPSASTTKEQSGTTASFSTNLPIPHTPATTNTIVGMTLTSDGKILDSAIVEILKGGQTIRATKSNKLGQFLFAKPLEDGLYQITADKEGHQFPRFDLDLKDKIIPPIRLQAIGNK